MAQDFEQGSYTDPKNLPKSSNLYYIKAGFIFKDDNLSAALRHAWVTITGDELPPVHEAKSMKAAFADYLMECKDRRDFTTTGFRHKPRSRGELSKLCAYAERFIINNWGTQTNPFGVT